MGSNPEYAQNNDDIKEKFRSDCDNWRPQSEHAAFGEYTTNENENATLYGLPVKDVKVMSHQKNASKNYVRYCGTTITK